MVEADVADLWNNLSGIHELVMSLMNSNREHEILHELLKTLLSIHNQDLRRQIGEELVRNNFATYAVQSLQEWQTDTMWKDEFTRHKLVTLYSILCFNSDDSTEFCRALSDAGISQVFKSNLRNRLFLDHLKPRSFEYFVINSTVTIMLNMLRRKNHKYYTPDNFEKISLVEIAASPQHQSTQTKLACMFTLTSVVSDEEMSMLEDMSLECISELVQYLKLALEEESHIADGYCIAELLDAAAGFGRFSYQRQALLHSGTLVILKDVCRLVGASATELESALNVLQVFVADSTIRPKVQVDSENICILKNLQLHASPNVSTLANQLLCNLENSSIGANDN